ncbi:MAG: hypothetical protein IJW37_00525 [Lachnospiraceae bacterium]|nr:hypothetical protein [Lachnospiraceae bacterium]
MKRFLVTTAIATLMLTAFAGCSKEKEQEQGTEATPTPSVTLDLEQGEVDLETILGENVTGESQIISLGGSFSNDNASLTVYLSDTGWNVSGIRFPEEAGDSSLLLSGPLTYQEPVDLVYEENGDKLTFTFASDSMTITVNEGTTYTSFAGEYERMANTTVPESETVVPKTGSVLESLGRTAAAYYMTTMGDSASFTLDPSTITFDNAFALRYVGAYTNLFLASHANLYTEIAGDCLYYAFAETDLNNVLLVASAGKFGVANLSVDGSDIVLKDDVYYVPCRGEYAGGIAVDSDDANKEDLGDTVFVEAVIVKTDSSRSDIDMTISVSANAAAGTTGLQIDSVLYSTGE